MKISPKFWAEHMGMPYHQADIRELERPKAGKASERADEAQRRLAQFLRYGYGDLLREDRKWSVMHRIWPGTQRLLLVGRSAQPRPPTRAPSASAAATASEICEPLSFKGRRGSGIAGDRCAYADTSLRPRWDWEKYVYGHRVWGRLLYNPECRARRLAALFAAHSSARAPAPRRRRAGQRQPHPADHHHGARHFGRQQHVLAGGVSESVDGGRRAPAALYRHPVAESVRQRQPARSAIVFTDQRFRGRVA